MGKVKFESSSGGKVLIWRLRVVGSHRPGEK